MTSPRRPAGRYDEPTPLSRPVLYGGAALLVLALTAATWFGYQRYSTGRVSYVTLFSTVVSDTETTVQFQVRKRDAAEVECRLNAVDADRAEVGTATARLGTSVHGTTTLTVSVATTRRAAGGQVLTCREVP